MGRDLEHKKEYQKEYYLKNKEKLLEYRKNFYNENKEIAIQRSKTWAENNKRRRKHNVLMSTHKISIDDYEDVATLNKWFISNYPMGRSDLSVISHDPEKGYILIQATIWRDSKDAAPAVSNVAFGSLTGITATMS